MDSHFMKAVAKIESDFNPKQRTGSYIGLFQALVTPNSSNTGPGTSSSRGIPRSLPRTSF